MRIAYVTETFLPSIDGVVTRVTKALDWLQAAGHEVLVICPDLGVTSYGSSRVVGVRAVRYPLYRARPWGTPSAAISRAMVLLPLPEGPTSATKLPSGTSMLTPCNISLSA